MSAPDPALVAGAFDRAAPTYDRAGVEFFAPFGKRLVELAAIGAGERVLDIGCGIGAVAFSVADRAGARVVAIDLNPENIATARARHAHERIDYRLGDALETLPDDAVDAVILSNVLEHLPERPQLLRRIVQLVRPARLFIRVPLFERDWRVPLRRELGVEWRLDADHETEYTIESFTAEMAEAGLAIRHLEVRWGEIWSEVVPK